MSKPERELPVAAAEGRLARETDILRNPEAPPAAPMRDSQQAAPVQAGNMETRRGALTAPLSAAYFQLRKKRQSTRQIFPISGLIVAPGIRAAPAKSTRHAGSDAQDRAGIASSQYGALDPRLDQFSALGRDANACGPDGRAANSQAG